MIAKFCDRCGKQLTDENRAALKDTKYEIGFHRGRILMFCKDCQAVIDYKIANECREFLPEKLVAETDIVKKEDE